MGGGERREGKEKERGEKGRRRRGGIILWEIGQIAILHTLVVQIKDILQQGRQFGHRSGALKFVVLSS